MAQTHVHIRSDGQREALVRTYTKCLAILGSSEFLQPGAGSTALLEQLRVFKKLHWAAEAEIVPRIDTPSFQVPVPDTIGVGLTEMVDALRAMKRAFEKMEVTGNLLALLNSIDPTIKVIEDVLPEYVR